MAPFDVFQTKDKQIAICCGNDELFTELCDALELPELTNDERFIHNADRVKNQAELKIVIEQQLSRHNADYWLIEIDKHRVPVAPLLNIAEAMALPQTQARNMLINAGAVKVPGTPIKLSSYPDPTERRGAPKLNEHGDALRAEFSIISNS